MIKAGGAWVFALAMLCAAASASAQGRTHAKALAVTTGYGTPVTDYAAEERAAVLAGAALLVNATDRGMAGKGGLNLGLARLPEAAVVRDIVYTPPVTPLLAAAKSRVNVAVIGLGLLLNQARPAFEAWFGVMPAIGPELIRAIQATF